MERKQSKKNILYTIIKCFMIVCLLMSWEKVIFELIPALLSLLFTLITVVFEIIWILSPFIDPCIAPEPSMLTMIECFTQ